MEYQSRGGGDWLAIGSRLSGRKQTLWEYQFAEHRSMRRQRNHAAPEPFVNRKGKKMRLYIAKRSQVLA